MNRMKDSRKTEKPLAKCCSPGTKESHFSTELWLAMKSGYIQLQANHRHRLQDQIAMDGRQCSVFGGIRRVWSIMELLKPGETVNTERYRQKSFEWKTTRISKEVTQSNFASWSCTIAYSKTGQGNDRSVQLGNTFARGLLTRLGSVRLLFICIDGTRAFWPALRFLRKCTKMPRWLVCLKRATVFLAWHPPIAKQVGKMYS